LKKTLTFLAVSSAVLVIGGCGGGASESGSTEIAAQYRGAFQMTNVTTQCEVVSIGYNSSLGIPVQVRTRGYDELIFGSDNTGYRICGDTVWVGKFAGAMTENSGSTAGQGSVNFTLYDRSGKVTGQTGAVTGSIFGKGGPVVVNLSMKNAANTDVDTTLSIGGVNVAYRNSITGSYSTLAGVYNGKAAGTTMLITSGGSLSGKLAQGAFTGSITAFHADTQVHDIAVTVTMANGATQNMTGVIGPYGSLPGEFDGNGVSVLPNGDSHPGVLIAIAGGGVAYADVFAQK
jgi:hypothetical protein